ncbi:unnamed protein product [Darwinula stevensoni]|uniref:Uncharacterized protein n=1 Tax=Darwinula stevensoni TaxID=69355 RepID=A0A7R9AER0_9CRUS|nr:unnamed protein product [Darwinula stevensoni]CAG0902292.1 unnamed protein product [Darwinula stevensoni]
MRTRILEAEWWAFPQKRHSQQIPQPPGKQQGLQPRLASLLALPHRVHTQVRLPGSPMQFPVPHAILLHIELQASPCPRQTSAVALSHRAARTSIVANIIVTFRVIPIFSSELRNIEYLSEDVLEREDRERSKRCRHTVPTTVLYARIYGNAHN